MSKKHKQAGLNRRGFLKAVGIGGAAAMLPGTVRAARKGAELATLLDISKCIACGECVYACRDVNADRYPEPKKPYPTMYPTGRVKVADWSDRRDVDDRLTPYNWLFIQTSAVEYEGREYELNIPRRCMHCQNAPCANLCPFGACGTDEQGITFINDQVCMGGSKCRSVCPWNVPQRQTGVGLYRNLLPNFAGNGVMYKCDRCRARIAEGELPGCIEACPEDVQIIGPRDEIVRKAHELADSMNGFIYGENENGGTNTLYVSPVPFELLDAAADKGPGRPHLKPVADSMAEANNLTEAALVAPFAGLVAGALGIGAKLLADGGDDDE